MKMILVLWNDACAYPSWYGDDEPVETSVIQTIGFLRNETKEVIELVSDVDEGKGMHGRIMVIQKHAVIKKRILK